MPPPDSTKIAVDRSMWGVRLENSERSVNTVRRVLTAPVVARPRGDFRGDRPEGRRQPVPDRLERRPEIPHLRHVPPHRLRRVRGATEAAPPDGGKRGPTTALNRCANRKSRSREGVLRYPVSATAAGKPLRREGPESFPSWTSPVRPRSPALRNVTFRLTVVMALTRPQPRR